MKIFKLFIPKEKAQVVQEYESWTVEWKIKTGWSNETETHYKVFVGEEDAIKFREQLSECASFIKCWINTKMYKN